MTYMVIKLLSLDGKGLAVRRTTDSIMSSARFVKVAIAEKGILADYTHI
jgi:hypothetical protein